MKRRGFTTLLFAFSMAILPQVWCQVSPSPDQDGSTSPTSPVLPITCYNCYNCITFESLQSRQCAADEKYCLKELLETGQVNRLCATEQKCNTVAGNDKYSCCTSDRCNGGNLVTTPFAAPTTLILLLLFLLLLGDFSG